MKTFTVSWQDSFILCFVHSENQSSVEDNIVTRDIYCIACTLTQAHHYKQYSTSS